MKKLMIAAAAVAFASVVNAAAVQWTITKIANSPANTAIETTSGQAMGYLFAAATYEDVVSQIAKGDFSAITSESYLSAQPTAAARGASITGLTGDMLSPGQSLNAYAILLDASSPTGAKNYAVTSIMTSGEAGDGGNVTWNMGEFAKITGGWTEIQSVPEPTSGLLLLLGVAGLALRRRRA